MEAETKLSLLEQFAEKLESLFGASYIKLGEAILAFLKHLFHEIVKIFENILATVHLV